MANGVNVGVYIPTTQVWDVTEIYTTDVTSPQFKELLVRMYQNLNLMAQSVNTRDAGIYDTSEIVCSQTYFPNPAYNSSTNTKPVQRQVYRKVINFGALPAGGTKSVPHGIICDSSVSFTRIYATATDPIALQYIPIPFATSTPNQSIQLIVDSVNVNISSPTDYSRFTICYIILEYIRF